MIIIQDLFLNIICFLFGTITGVSFSIKYKIVSLGNETKNNNKNNYEYSNPIVLGSKVLTLE